MDELIKAALEAPVANLLIIAGLVFLGIAVVGRVGDRIEPDKTGRMASGGLGALLLVIGLAMHLLTDSSTSPTSAATAEPSTSPTSTATSAPSSCRDPAIERFRDIYEPERLGCPVGASVGQQMARQDFKKGVMLWRADPRQIYALYDDGQWQAFDDSWDEGQPAISCPEAETHTISVARGFGKVWCHESGVQNRLGRAETQEYATTGDVQDFERGVIIFEAEAGETFVLDAPTGQWTR